MIKIDEANENVPCVSIIVTTFNRVRFLRETLDTILAQSFSDFELIVVDNMSVDETSEVISRLSDSRIQYFKNPNYGVIAVNRNYGIRKARGRYVAFCDDDDLWFPNKLKLQVDLLERNQAIALCYTNAESFIGTGDTISHLMIRRSVNKHHFFQLLRGNFIPNSSVLLRRNIFFELGFLNEDPDIREDYDMWLRIARRYSIAGLSLALIKYRIHLLNAAGNRASETLRAIRTASSIMKSFHIPLLIAWPSIAFQYAKYIIYRLSNK